MSTQLRVVETVTEHLTCWAAVQEGEKLIYTEHSNFTKVKRNSEKHVE